jgi:rhodanese-related sulfurtransferase
MALSLSQARADAVLALPRVAPRLAILCAIAAGTGWLANRVRAEPIKLTSYAAPTQCSEAASSSTASVLSAQSVSALCGRNNVLFADARDEAQFEQGHVTGAIHLACTSSRGDVGQLLAQLEGKDTLVVYGKSTKEARQVADGLLRQTKRRDLSVIVLDGGFAAWRDTGLACSSGACDHCESSSVNAHR